MPSKSKSQQRFMGMVRAAQKGELENPSKSVKKAAKSMDKDDNLTLFIKKNDEQNLGIKRYNPEKKKETIDLMQLIELNKEKYTIPPAVFESVIKMPSNDFHKVCREMSNIADYVEISCINNKLIFK